MSAQCTAQTVAGERCKAFGLAGTDPALCAHHAGVRRPMKFSEQTVERIVAVLRAGNYPAVAAAAAGITEKTYYQWLRWGRSDAAADAPYRDFATRVERALSEGEARNVTLVASAATENWQAAAWMLERRWPERWARVNLREKDERPAQPDPADPFAEVDELAARRRAPAHG